ncbi:DEAD/DEAH box helicase [Limosilactobacillus reuteri]|uniref:DEAD/DEAH box helicase n=1 Tax=Limosilactobacillus reuteri TaxID=1598 RepID=UPI00234A7C3B|nr:DEAD/DEAH box helicase [Limosilactobacillus reuteri]MDC6076600.1 DEAD/DEAH box helicase [Limosilactobacillus reuteri]
MPEQDKTLAEYLYGKLKRNSYLRKLIKKLFTQYSFFLFGAKWSLKDKEKTDLLRFADLLSKTKNSYGQADCKNLSLKIMALLNKMYPKDPSVNLVSDSVLSSLNNYLPRQNNEYSKMTTIDFLWDEIIDNYNVLKRRIPGTKEQTFIGDQDKIFASLNENVNSFSAPTSMGKTYLIKKFIEYKVKSGESLNFAITVPSKALITEIRNSLLENLGTNLNKNFYRIISSAEEYALEYQNRNYIFIMTPERLSNLLSEDKKLRLNYLFIDESQKITEVGSRSIFYYDIIDQVQKWERMPRLTFASPLIPNPAVFLQLLDSCQENSIRVDESPVTQSKFLIDRHKEEFYIFNDWDNKAQLLSPFSETSIPHIVRIIVNNMGRKTQSLVYYSSKAEVMSDAVIFARQLPDIENRELEKLADYIGRKIHPKYELVNLVRKGIAFHIGELPVDVRTKIEEAYRKGLLKVIFCTSTLLEGVNLPADNIFVTSLNNGKKKLSHLEFLNLIGRVGRLGHSMSGDVFLITGKKKKSHSNMAAYLRYLSNDLKNEKLSVQKALKPKQVALIKESLYQGDLKLNNIDDKKNYDFLRKVSLVYIKEINQKQQGFTRKQFRKSLSEEDEKKITKVLHDKYPDELQDDINFSADQTNLLKQSISTENIREFPQIFTKDHKLNLADTYNFFIKLSRIFNWRLYEQKFVIPDANEEVQQDVLRDYAKLTLLWISGYSLKDICSFAIKNRQSDSTFLDRLDRDRRLVGNINWETIISNTVMRQLNKLNFVLGKYFLKVSKELSANGSMLENNWYRYLEYGTNSKLRIWLQQNGYSREASQYIELNADKLIIGNGPLDWLISDSINEVDDSDVVDETKEVRANVPEIFN